MEQDRNRYRQERQFAVILAGIVAVTGIGLWLKDEPLAWSGVAVATVLLLLAWRSPCTLTPLLDLWMRIGHVVGAFNTRLLLALVFFLLITPVALLFRMSGRDTLRLHGGKQGGYWQPRETSWSPDSFRDQH